MYTKVYFLILLLFIASVQMTHGQNINTPENFPDPIFRAAVEEFMEVEVGGEFTAEQAAAKTGWFDECSSRNIQDLSGIEFFTGITGLACDENQLTDLDISKNTALTYINCSYNQLTGLDVSQNTNLTSLYCWNNQLTALDVSDLTTLYDLSCDDNQLTAIDVSNNTELVFFDCSGNQLSAIDISKNTKLEYLNCSENIITVLDLAKNNALNKLSAESNQLTSLDVSHNTALEIFGCANNQLTTLDLSQNTALTELNCHGNQLRQLDLSKQTALQYLHCASNQLTNLDLTHNPALLTVESNNNQLITINLSNTTVLDELYCGGNQLTQLNLTNNTALTLLNCRDNPLQTLDLSQNTTLTTLSCINDQLTTLDVSNNVALETVDCWSNELTSLDFSNNPALSVLNCSYNSLQSIDVSQNTELTYLNCYENQLANISTLVDNEGISGDDTIDVRQNDLSFDDWQDVLTLRNRLNEPTFYSWGEIESGFAYSPQKGFDPYDFSDISPTPTYTFTPEPTATPVPAGASPQPTDTPTPTQLPPTSTPTAPTQNLYVYDNSSDTTADLSGQTDYDPETNRNLSIAWDAPQWDASDWHVYIRKGFGGSKYLGHTGDGSTFRLDWSSLSSNIAGEFSGGPDFNSLYTFRAIRIDGSLDPYDYIDMSAPVGYNLEGGNPVSISQPAMPNLNVDQIVIYDDLLGGDDLAPTGMTGSDTDYDDSRAIQIAWNFGVDASTVNEYHILVKVDGGEYQFLGQTYNGNITYFWWTPNSYFRTATTFTEGPQDGHSYQFMVILQPLTGNTQNMVSGLLNYSVIARESAGSGQSQSVFIYDTAQDTTGDLTGQTDFDAVDNRNMTIAWTADQGNATDWHVYVRKGLGGSKYLGRTASGSATRLNWSSTTQNLADEFAQGPDLNASYIFRVIRIDGQRDADDYFDALSPVGFNLEGGNAVSLSKPEPPNLATGTIAIYDDIVGGNNLAPTSSHGSDTDSENSRAIQIAWNFGRDGSTVNEYHISVSVDGEQYQFLGQTYDGRIPYFLWSPSNEFRTNPTFSEGPQNGHTYQFRVFLIPLSGQQTSLETGTLDYFVN